MSKIFISADIEGVAGVVDAQQTIQGQPEFETARRWMTLEVNAAIEGAIAAGATEFVVCDAHAHMQNLLPDLLHPEARLVRGALRDSLQMQGIDRSFDALFVTGAHAAAGTRNAVLDHTWVGRSVFHLRMDGRSLNEACLNAITAGYHGVPLALVTGDETTVEQTRAVHPDIEAAVVKTSYSRYCAESLHPSKAQELIRQAAEQAVRRLAAFQPVKVPETLRMEIEFLRTDMADAAALVPGMERLDARTVAYTGHPETIFKLQELVLYRIRYD